MSEETELEHVSDAEIEAFVIGALEGGAAEAFERHVTACRGCAAKLEAEAKLEMSLVDVHAAVPRPSIPAKRDALSPRRSTRTAVVVGGAVFLAAAAIAALVLRRSDPPADRAITANTASPRPSALPPVVCADFETQSTCIEEAHRRGLYVRVPTGAGAPPLGARTSVGPTSPPFPLSRRSER